MSEEHGAGEALLRTGLIVPVRVVDEAVMPGADEGELALQPVHWQGPLGA